MAKAKVESGASSERHPRGGLYFEDFIEGTVYAHRLTRTVTQMDNMLFSNMTLNPQPLHIDAHFCATETEWGRPMMNSLFTLGLMIGISVNDLTVGTDDRQSRHDRCALSRILCSRATRCARRRPWSRNARLKSRPDAGSSSSITAPSSRTARWSPNAPPRVHAQARRREGRGKREK